MSDFPYYNTVDQICHAEWSIPKLARLELLRNSIQTLWPNGHPTKLVHVAGTGGKGSTCRFLELGFSCIGKAGAFMSPHLFDYRERFSINGEFVEHQAINQAWEEHVKPHCVQISLNNQQHTHSFLEVSILIALTLFEQQEVEWAAIETGVGGRYDQTRALDVVATLLTNIGSDHAHMLGREQWQRALDKAGIARPNVPFFTTEQNAENVEIIRSVCQEVTAPLTRIGQSEVDALENQVTVLAKEPIPPESLLSAAYQKWNATLGLATIQHLCPKAKEPEIEAKILNAFLQGRLLGRFWKVEEGVYADIAHNVEKVDAFADEFNHKFGDMEKILILGASRYKVPYKLFPKLAKTARAIIITGASFKGQDPNQVRDELESLNLDTPIMVILEPRLALQVAKEMRQAKDIIILTGSTYMIEQVLNPDPYLRHLNSTFGWTGQSFQDSCSSTETTRCWDADRFGSEMFRQT